MRSASPPLARVRRGLSGVLSALLLLAALVGPFLSPPGEVEEASTSEVTQVAVDSGPQADGLLKSDLSRSIPHETSVDRIALDDVSEQPPSTPRFGTAEPAEVPERPAVRRALLRVYRL